MSEAEIVNLGADPVAERRAVRRRLVRVVAPIMAALLLVLSVVGLVVAGYEGNRRGALALSGDLLEGLERRIALRVTNWLTPAERALRLLHGVWGDGARLERTTREDALRLSMRILENVPSIALVSLADPAGNFVLQRRNDQGGIDTKTIEKTPGPRKVTWVRRDRDGTVTGTEEDPSDTFDPRMRPWFIAAVASNDVIWTEPYIFFTDRMPGVTAAVAFRDNGVLRGVIGVDIRLNDLSAFLSRLEIGRTGRAIIVDGGGRIVAHPDPALSVRESGGTLLRPRLDELGDPVLTRAFDLFRVNGRGRFTFALGGRDHIVIWSPLPEAGDGSWSLLLTVPEAELVGFVASASRLTSLLGALVVVVALGLAFMLVRQGLRADRMERALERRGQAMAAQAAALANLGRSAAVHDPTRDEGLALLTATLCDALAARRASIWRATPGGDTLICEDIFEAASGSHAHGQRLGRAEHAAFFAALARGDVFEATEGARDPRTATLATSLLADTGTQGVLCVPAMRGARLAGAIIVEDRSPGAVPQSLAFAFGLALAAIAVARLAAAETVQQGLRTARGETRRDAPPRLAAPPPALGHSIEEKGALPAPASALPLREGIVAEFFPAVTVMALAITDPSCLAETVAEAGGSTLADQIVRALQAAAEEQGLAYLRVMGDRAIVADGFGDRAEAAAEAVPAFAIDVAERLSALFAGLDRAPAFRIGIDTGAVIGSPVGRGARSYNIWGEAVRGAEAMAASAPPGMVQMTERLQARVGDRFMVRPRGRFWVPGTGETATFLLAGRA